MRVVADTNTVVSAFLWGGAPADVLTTAREQRVSLFTSATLIAELEDVLGREKFAKRIAQVGSTVADLVAGYRALAQLVRTAAIAPVSRDPDDDHVLACALAASATVIVTRDKDLLTLDPFQGIRLLSAQPGDCTAGRTAGVDPYGGEGQEMPHKVWRFRARRAASREARK